MKTIVVMILVALSASVTQAKARCESLNLNTEKEKIAAHAELDQDAVNTLVQSAELVKYGQLVECAFNNRSLTQEEVRFATSQARAATFQKISELKEDIEQARYELANTNMSPESQRLFAFYVETKKQEISEAQVSLQYLITYIVKAGR